MRLLVNCLYQKVIINKITKGYKMLYSKESLVQFEREFDAYHPELGSNPIKMLGYGEISFVFSIDDDSNGGIAFKRLPIFSSEQEIESYIESYAEYEKILRDTIHLDVPEQDSFWCHAFNRKGKELSEKITLFCMQKKINSDYVCNNLLHTLGDDDIIRLLRTVCHEIFKVFDFNLKSNSLKVGLDGQISNWFLSNADSTENLPADPQLSYLDTSTPLFRVDGEESMNPELFLKSAPGFMRWLLKWLFLDEVVDRYYDLRLVLTDLIANFYKEQRADIIGRAIIEVNDLLSERSQQLEDNSPINPFSIDEIRKYYEDDKKIWVIFQNARRLDRWITTKILLRRYDYFLPGKIKR